MRIICISALVALLAASAPVESPPRQSQRPSNDPFSLDVKVKVPVVLCIDDKPSLGGQPTGEAYRKAAANGFRSVLTLRSSKDGIDTIRERLLVENQKLRYFNLPSTNLLPDAKQIDEFLHIAKDPTNHPMLVNCAFAERVAPYMLIFRLREQSWSEERGLDEVVRLGLDRDKLRKFARAYLNKQPDKQ